MRDWAHSRRLGTPADEASYVVLRQPPASKLPTYYLVHKAPPRPSITLTSPQHAKVAVPKYTKVTRHAVAVDHLLVTKSLQVPKKPLARH